MEDSLYFMAIWSMYCRVIWYILGLFVIFYDHLVYFSRFGMLYEEKSSNPAVGTSRVAETGTLPSLQSS
jgi:hypothetical protein